MPKLRAKPNSKTAPGPIPLLDSLRTQNQSSSVQKHENDSDHDDSTVTSIGWQCNQNDWSDRKTINRTPDVFPQTLRSIERKNEQTKNNFFRETLPKPSTGQIELSKLTNIVSDLILGKHDQFAYKEFLSILQHYSVRLSRDDHLEETVYHLIQSAVSFIRSNEERFDPSQLEECYRQRYLLKSKSSQ